ncbi:MAG: urea amidolyase associated protein UAAP1 [Aquisalimonadaceae bacterium]
MTAKPIPEERLLHRETVPGARYWSMVIRRGNSLRVQDMGGGANVSMLLYNPGNLLERYNMADTLKGQHTSKLTRGNMLYSDMGRVMMSIVEDSVGWHDTIGGITDADHIRRQYGEARYQEHRNAFYRSGRELFLIELEKWGLGRRDLVPNLNFFSKVYADEDGGMAFAPSNSRAGDHVDLRAEMDTLVVLNTAPHPMDTATEYRPAAVDLSIYRAEPVGEDDYCVNFRPENARAYANTAILNCQGYMP